MGSKDNLKKNNVGLCGKQRSSYRLTNFTKQGENIFSKSFVFF